MVTKVYGDTGVDKIVDGSVTGSKIVDGSVTGSDLESGISFDASNLTNVPSASKAYFSAYQTTGVNTLTTSYTKMNIGTLRKNSGDFTWDATNSRVTVDKTGTYMVAYSISTDCTSGTARTESQAVLYQNGVEVDGTFVGMYNRLAGQGLSNGAMTMVMDITSGDYFEIFALKTGTDTVQQTPHGTNLTFIEL